MKRKTFINKCFWGKADNPCDRYFSACEPWFPRCVCFYCGWTRNRHKDKGIPVDRNKT